MEFNIIYNKKEKKLTTNVFFKLSLSFQFGTKLYKYNMRFHKIIETKLTYFI